jgi:hypothetical protein
VGLRSWQQDLSGHVDAEAAPPGRYQPQCFATCGERALCHVDQVLRLGTGHLDRLCARLW